MNPAQTIPEAPGGLPLLGHTLSLVRNPLGVLDSLTTHRGLALVRVGTVKVIVVCDPELTQQILVADRVFDKIDWFDAVREAAGGGLLTCPHSEHRRLRRLIQPAFHPARLTEYSRTMTRHADAVTRSWHAGQDLDVPAEMTTLAALTLMETMFSESLPQSATRPAAEDLAIVARGTYLRTVLPRPLTRLPLPATHRYHQALRRARHIFGEILARRRASGKDSKDLLSALLAAGTPGGGSPDQGLTDTEIIDQLITFYGAGTETTAMTLTWALHLLAHHRDIEDRVHAEVDTVLAGAPASAEHLPDLRLTSRVITETLRLYQPVLAAPRTVTTNIRLGEHHLPAGTSLAYSPYLIHHRSDLYQQPERFDPDRWDSDLHPPTPRNTFLPFGAGARKCIGDQFAIIEATLALATITARWRLEPLSRAPVQISVATVLTPRDLHMRATPRRACGGSPRRTG